MLFLSELKHGSCQYLTETWGFLQPCSDFLHRMVGAAALHAGVTPVTCFTLGFIFSSHLDEEITCSWCMERMVLPARTEQVFVLDDSPHANKEQPALTLSCYRGIYVLSSYSFLHNYILTIF